jgi:hypothetical protein
LARRQREIEIAHDRSALRVALQTELKILKDIYEGRIETLAKAEIDQSSDVLIPADTMTDIYEELIDRLGLLTPDEIEKVMRAYLLIQQLPGRIRLLLWQSHDQIESAEYMRVGRKHFVAVKAIHKNYLTQIELAIMALSD